jgi:hypothetical protein
MELASVVIVFTKYDLLVRKKKIGLQEGNESLSEEDLREQSEKEAQEVLDKCIQFLEGILSRMYTQESRTPKPRHVIVSSINSPLFVHWIHVHLSP